MKSTVLNVLTNYGNKLWGILSIYLFVPLYIQLLGVEAYGIISFYTVVLSIISLADLGLSSAVIKEFSASFSDGYKYSVFKLVEKKYFIICGTVLLGLLLTSNFIAVHWLQTDKFPIEDLTKYVMLISFGVSFHLCSSLYYGALFGLGYQARANMYQFFWALLRTGVVVIILRYVSNSLYSYFFWQIICNVGYVFLLRYSVLSYFIKRIKVLYLEFVKLPKHILIYIGGMSLISIISAVNTQMDKILISSLFTLKVFGYYTLASSLAQSPTLLGMPLATSLFPTFVKLVSERDMDGLKSLFRISNYILNVIVFIVSFSLYFYISDLFRFWLGNRIEEGYREDMEFLARTLIVGTVFLSMQLLFYYALLAFGKTKYTVYQGVFQITMGVPLLYYFIHVLGFRGAGYSWIVINLGAYIYLFFPLRKLFDYGFYKLFVNYTVVPFVICLVVFVSFYFIYSQTLYFHCIFYIAISSVFAVFCCIFYLFKLSNIPLKLSGFKDLMSRFRDNK
ncbi:lipopolysaccharide biosynthesis protein [Sphingobacterium sp. 18053]|uniref:lipopolysaccharide biosynthesis protein n=1 Tax=Sphingobacterium sp. 18053 TaxID=2681401 RepID=UPI001358B395|nr:oligosaccharide flippase family protein [Sphingobacterium sp. 18053]